MTERDDLIHEIDVLKSALRFVAQLHQRMMPSTASRLAVAQRKIDYLATSLRADFRRV